MRDGSNSQDRWSSVYAVHAAHIYAHDLDKERMGTADAV